MSFLWDSLYSVFLRTRNYLVDPPGEENPELATTGEGRGATTGDPTWGSDPMATTREPCSSYVVTTQAAGGAHPVMEAVVTSTTEDARRQQQSPRSSISIVTDSRGAPTFNLFDMSAQTPMGASVAWGDADAQLHPQPTAHRSRSRERHRAFHRHRFSTSRSSNPDVRHRHRIRPQQCDGAGSFEALWENFENCATYNKWTEADKLAHLKVS